MSERNEWNPILRGVVLVIGLHIAAIIVMSLIIAVLSGLSQILPVGLATGISQISFISLLALFGIGVSQLIYIVPTIVILKRDRRYGLMKGVIIGAILTALLNGGCYLWFVLSFR